MSSKKAEGKTKEEQHCVRCHEPFVPGDKKDKCIIEHDTDLFSGSRNGTSWYTGKLGCCGADYRFHRHYSDGEKADPKYCFEGRHTTNPNEVEYNNTTVKHCTEDECGEELHKMTKKLHEKQMEGKKRAREAKKAAKKEEKASKRSCIEKLYSEGNRRDARRLRAEMLGMDPDDEFLNSDIDPDGCEEFDFLSDSSIVPPWAMDGGDY